MDKIIIPGPLEARPDNDGCGGWRASFWDVNGEGCGWVIEFSCTDPEELCKEYVAFKNAQREASMSRSTIQS